MKDSSWVWFFKKDGIPMVSAVFSSLENADNWLKLNKLTKIITLDILIITLKAMEERSRGVVVRIVNKI